jgi:YHS domain-containing protein
MLGAMLRLIVAIVIVYLVYRLAKTFFLPSGKMRERFPGEPTPIDGEDMVQDPYCKTYIPLSNAYKASVDGKTCYFCSQECCEKYKAERRKK